MGVWQVEFLSAKKLPGDSSGFPARERDADIFRHSDGYGADNTISCADFGKNPALRDGATVCECVR